MDPETVLQWDWRTDDEGNADCGVFFMVFDGHAYAFARCPKYLSKEQWESNAKAICAIPDLVKALKRARSYVKATHGTLVGAVGEQNVVSPDLEMIDAALRKAGFE